jgi:hypothetical protein
MEISQHQHMQDFKLGGVHLKKLRRAEGGAKNFGVFRVKNHDFTPKNLILPILGVFTMLNNLKRDVAIPYRILDHHCINCLLIIQSFLGVAI